MKFKDYLAEASTDKHKIDAFLATYNHGEVPPYTISEGRIDLDGFQQIGTPNNKIIGELPDYIQFGHIMGGYSVGGNDLTSLRGCPIRVDGDFSCFGNKRLTSIEFFPKQCNIIRMGGTGITSLAGISNIVQSMNEEGQFEIEWSKIKEGGIGLILIPGLKKINGREYWERSFPSQIIEKYIGRPDDIFECQAELIENGFEEYALL